MVKFTEPLGVSFYLLDPAANNPVVAYPVTSVILTEGDFMTAINTEGLHVLSVPRENISYISQFVVKPDDATGD